MRNVAGRPVDREALTVAMALVPTLYARNRMHAFCSQPEVRRAKARAALLRGVIRQLAGSHGKVEGFSLVRARDVAHASADGEAAVLRYRVPQVHLERRVLLSDLEAACLAHLAARAGVAGIEPHEGDRMKLDAALRRLAADGHSDGIPTLLQIG